MPYISPTTCTSIDKQRSCTIARPQMATARTAPTDLRTTLALERTRLAHERTLMAWVRTATSLISFGFTIYKFFQYLRQSQPAAVGYGRFAPRSFALVMIGLGIGALTLATIQHRRDLNALQGEYGALPRSTAAIVASIVAILGILALVLVLFHQ